MDKLEERERSSTQRYRSTRAGINRQFTKDIRDSGKRSLALSPGVISQIEDSQDQRLGFQLSKTHYTVNMLLELGEV